MATSHEAYQTVYQLHTSSVWFMAIHCVSIYLPGLSLYTKVLFISYSVQKQPLPVLLKKMFLKILQNSQENTSARISFLIKLQTQVTPFLQKISGRLLLSIWICLLLPEVTLTIALSKSFSRVT